MNKGADDFIEVSIERVSDPEQRAFVIWAKAALDKFDPEDAQTLVTLLNLEQAKRLVESNQSTKNKSTP